MQLHLEKTVCVCACVFNFETQKQIEIFKKDY